MTRGIGPRSIVGPGLAVLCAVALGSAVVKVGGDHDAAQATRRWLTDVAHGRAAAADAEVRVVRAERARGRYPYLRTYVYVAHPDAARIGTRLRQDDDADRDAVDALQEAPVYLGPDDGGPRAAVRQGEAVFVIASAAPLPPARISWLAVVLAAVGGGALWLLLILRLGRRGVVSGGLALTMLMLAAFWPTLVALTPSIASVAVSATVLPVTLGMVLLLIVGVSPSPHRVAYAYVAPAALGLGLLILAPFAFGVALAFTRQVGDELTWVGLDNFIDILRSEGYSITQPLSFYFTLAVTVLWTAVNVSLHVCIGLVLALLLHQSGQRKLRFAGVYRVLLILPWAVPSYITALIWKGMFNKEYGLINHVLLAVLGPLGFERIGWFSGFWTSFSANVITNTWLGFPFMMVVSLGALASIPEDIYEAAEIEGASRWARFWHITLPLLRPALLPAVILGSIWTFNMFNIIYLVSGGQPNNSTDILITEAYRWAFERDRYGYAAAYSVLIFLILLSYSLLTQRVGRSAEAS